jgi:hypothetical protein
MLPPASQPVKYFRFHLIVVIYGVRVKCNEDYDKGLVLELEELGLDRIKMHDKTITAEYKIPPPVNAMCRNCVRDNVTTPLSETIIKSQHAGSVEKVEFWRTNRYKIIYGIASLIYRLSPEHKIYSNIMKKALKEAGVEKINGRYVSSEK